MLHSVASGPFGEGVNSGGVATALAGLAVHFAIMTVMVAIFVTGARRLPFVTAHPLIAGIAHGVALYLFMYWVVLPLRWPDNFPSLKLRTVASALFAHIVCVGIPMALITARGAGPGGGRRRGDSMSGRPSGRTSIRGVSVSRHAGDDLRHPARGRSEPQCRARALYVEETGVGGRTGGRAETWPETRAKLVLTLSMRGASYTIFGFFGLLAGNPHPLASSIVRALVYVVGITVCYGMHRLLRRLSHRSFRTRALALALTAPFAAETFAWLNYFAFAAFDGRTLWKIVIGWNDVAHVLSLWTWFFIAWTGLYLAIEYSFDAKEEARRSAELRNLAHNAKLARSPTRSTRISCSTASIRSPR